MMRKYHVRFGGGLLEKEPKGHLVSSLPYNICAWMLWPYDYLGDLMAENAYGRGQGFFPTPMSICTMLASMLMEGEEDMRTKAVSDPAVGTGRFLLTASNYSVRLYGQDIDQMMCQATLVNGYLFAPWLVKPFPFLQGIENDRTDEGLNTAHTVNQLPALIAAPAIANVDTASVPLGRSRKGRRIGTDPSQGKLF